MKLKGEFYLTGVPDSEINGAGSKGFGNWVRDSWGSVSFRKASNVHDAEYYWMKSVPNKDILKIKRKCADIRFLENMETLNKSESKTKLGYYARMPIIYCYYAAVRCFGGFFV